MNRPANAGPGRRAGRRCRTRAGTGAFIEKQGWVVGKAGQVRGEFGPLYKHGYINAIKKVLAEIE